MTDWRGLIIVKEIQHKSSDGRVLWEDRNLHNLLHTSGEEFILKSLFVGGKDNNNFIPNNYYFGLDARSTLAVGDTMTTIATDGGEPSANGYIRQEVASLGQFAVGLSGGVNQASTPIITFTAAAGPWGPVSNLFLTTSSGNSGYLIASVPLSQALTVNSGETVSVRMGLSLRDCPV
jgi:hypothetical protein